MSRLTKDEILDITEHRTNSGYELRIRPANDYTFFVSSKDNDFIYYYDIYLIHFLNQPTSVNAITSVQLPSGISNASNLPNTTSGNIAVSNGFNWKQIYIREFDSEDTSPEFQKEKPIWLKITECSCGVWTTYGKDYPADKHSDWCDVYKEEMKIQSITKISSDDVPF